MLILRSTLLDNGIVVFGAYYCSTCVQRRIVIGHRPRGRRCRDRARHVRGFGIGTYLVLQRGSVCSKIVAVSQSSSLMKSNPSSDFKLFQLSHSML